MRLGPDLCVSDPINCLGPEFPEKLNSRNISTIYMNFLTDYNSTLSKLIAFSNFLKEADVSCSDRYSFLSRYSETAGPRRLVSRGSETHRSGPRRMIGSETVYGL